MPVLPASVRVSLWGSAALNDRVGLGEVCSRALPDIDDVTGLTEPLHWWRDVGEQVLLVALPRPGRTQGMPSGPVELLSAASEAHEMVFVPSLGGALVPSIEPFGSAQERGWRARWLPYPSDPVPRHTVQALSLPEAERRLREVLAELTEQLSVMPGSPMAAAATELQARRAVDDRWGMPPGLPRRCVRVVELAGSVLHLSDLGLGDDMHSVDSAATTVREQLLLELRDEAMSALATATNVAALSYAGWA